MARQAWINDAQRRHGFRCRDYHRCSLCGRRRGYMRRFGLCRICFRENALAGNVPGVRKSSW